MELLEKVVALEDEASRFGFRWENTEQIMDQIRSECAEISEQLLKPDEAALQEEIGDLLHAVFSLCVFCKFSPKATLDKTLVKFERRLQAVKGIAEENGLINLEGKSFDELMQVWDKAKKMVG